MRIGDVGAAAAQGASVQVLAKVQDQAKLEGRSALRLIETAGEVRRQQQRIDRGDGTGKRLDVTV